ncbi:hypothetical protein [Candidatus Chromulinivorax destructor]|nr:hypothetical protein [Candidatus Chromulinivorax destructor]
MFLFIFLNSVNLESMEKSSSSSLYENYDLGGDRCIEGGAGTYPPMSDEELAMRKKARKDKNNKAQKSWTAKFCGCISNQNVKKDK